MSNIDELIKMFKDALRNKSDIVLDPYDYGLVVKILDLEDSVRLYNSLASMFDEAVEENIADPHEIILTYDGRLYRRIIKRLEGVKGRGK